MCLLNVDIKEINGFVVPAKSTSITAESNSTVILTDSNALRVVVDLKSAQNK